MSKKIIDNSQVGVRSIHHLPFNWLGSADFGRIVPFHVQELIGTDKVVTCKPRIELQMLPLASPTFGKMDLYVHYFFVPTRQLWQPFFDFYSRSGEGQSSTPPYWTKKDFADAYSGVADYQQRALYKHWTSMGLPPFFTESIYSEDNDNTTGKHLTVLPFRAYNKIWWDFYRDPELISDASKSQYVYTSSGRQSTSLFDTLHQFAPKLRQYNNTWLADLFATNGTANGPVGAVITPDIDTNPGFGGTGTNLTFRYDPATGNVGVGSYVSTTATDAIGEIDSATMRKMEALTRMAERLSLGGKRQIERLFAQYGIKPAFSRMEMCEYVGGAKATVLVSDITSSADTTGNYISGESSFAAGAPLGQKAGAGYCAFNKLNIQYEAKEPGYLIGVFSVMPHMHFVQGIGKQWYRNTLEDWFTRQLEHTGMVAVPKEEVGVRQAGYIVGLDDDDNTFAFTQPYYEYKRNTDILAGDFMKYFSTPNQGDSGDKDIQYMQSMGLYQFYGSGSRIYSAETMQVDAVQANKIFFYMGGNMWSDVDDHFHVNCDVDVTINRPMDGFAVPTLETTENPHQSKTSIGSDNVL